MQDGLNISGIWPMQATLIFMTRRRDDDSNIIYMKTGAIRRWAA